MSTVLGLLVAVLSDLMLIADTRTPSLYNFIWYLLVLITDF